MNFIFKETGFSDVNFVTEEETGKEKKEKKTSHHYKTKRNEVKEKGLGGRK